MWNVSCRKKSAKHTSSRNFLASYMNRTPLTFPLRLMMDMFPLLNRKLALVSNFVQETCVFGVTSFVWVLLVTFPLLLQRRVNRKGKGQHSDLIQRTFVWDLLLSACAKNNLLGVKKTTGACFYFLGFCYSFKFVVYVCFVCACMQSWYCNASKWSLRHVCRTLDCSNHFRGLGLENWQVFKILSRVEQRWTLFWWAYIHAFPYHPSLQDCTYWFRWELLLSVQHSLHFSSNRNTLGFQFYVLIYPFQGCVACSVGNSWQPQQASSSLPFQNETAMGC